MLLIMAESNIECGFMEDFVEEVVQQQDSQGEQDAVQATEETMEAVPCEAPCGPAQLYAFLQCNMIHNLWQQKIRALRKDCSI